MSLTHLLALATENGPWLGFQEGEEPRSVAILVKYLFLLFWNITTPIGRKEWSAALYFLLSTLDPQALPTISVNGAKDTNTEVYWFSVAFTKYLWSYFQKDYIRQLLGLENTNVMDIHTFSQDFYIWISKEKSISAANCWDESSIVIQ